MPTITVTTANIRSDNPVPGAAANARIAQAAALPGAVLGQEIDNPAYDKVWDTAMKAAGKTTWCQKSECPISVPADWPGVRARIDNVHGGLAGVSPHRDIAVVHADVDSARLSLLGCHTVSKPRPGVDESAWRIARWNEYIGALKALVATEHEVGLTVVFGGDLNQVLSKIPTIHPDAVLLASSGLDHLWVLPAKGWAVTGVKKQVIARTEEMDHPLVSATFELAPVVAPPKPPEVPVPDDRYDKVKFRGKIVNKWTRAALLEAESRLGYELTIVQGSYNRGVGASAGTHDGGGAIDLAPFEAARKVKVLREVGFAAWHRTKIPGLWNEHVHAVLIGDKSATPAAQRQVTSYFNGRDGLKGNRVDKTWRPAKIPTFAYPPKTDPTPPPKPLAQVVDYSFDRPSPAKLKAAGFVGAMRYISYGSKKDITKAEAKALRDAGLWIGLVWETSANRAGQGAAPGKADVIAAEKAADALGYPDDAVIFYAVDFDADPAKVQPYFHAVKAGAKRPVGIYGSHAIVTAGFTKWRWQATAWSHGKRDAKANLFQKLGADIPGTDENDLLKPFPCWKP